MWSSSSVLFVPERNFKLRRKHKRTQEMFSPTLIYKMVIRCYIISQCAQTYCTKSFSHWTFNLIYIMDLLLYTGKGQPFPCSSRSYHIGLLLEINASNILCDMWCTMKFYTIFLIYFAWIIIWFVFNCKHGTQRKIDERLIS